jgi:hypothetical protein
MRRNSHEFGPHPDFIGPPAHHIAVIERRLHAGLTGHHLEPV